MRSFLLTVFEAVDAVNYHPVSWMASAHFLLLLAPAFYFVAFAIASANSF